MLDITGPAQVFSSANRELDANQSSYQIYMTSTNGGMISTDTGIELVTIAIADLVNTNTDTIVVAGGDGVFNAIEDKTMISWLKDCGRTR